MGEGIYGYFQSEVKFPVQLRRWEWGARHSRGPVKEWGGNPGDRGERGASGELKDNTDF